VKIKKICRLLSLLCLLTVGILFQTQPVKAVQAGQQSYDSDKKGSIQVCLDDIGTDRSLVSLYCYKVGSPKLYENNLEGWTVQETFESLNLDFNHLGDTEVHRESARKLVAFIEENGKIRPVQTGVTDKNGECIFSALPQGVYLIVQKDSFDDYGTTEPFLMTVPYIEDDMVIYDVVTQTKGEKPVPPEQRRREPIRVRRIINRENRQKPAMISLLPLWQRRHLYQPLASGLLYGRSLKKKMMENKAVRLFWALPYF